MPQPGYPAARIVARNILNHLNRHARQMQIAADKRPASQPDTAAIEAMVDAAFWASLRREEGRTPTLSLAFVGREESRFPLTLERPLPLIAEALTRIAPAVERPGIHLAVWPDGERLSVWGATRDLPAFCFVVEVIAPGLLVIKQSPGEDAGKFVNVAMLEGDTIHVVNQEAAKVPDCPDLLTSLLGFETQHGRTANVNVLIQLAVSMRDHGHGGLLLVVPADSSEWLESMVRPILYAVSPPFSVLSRLMEADPGERSERSWQDALRRAVSGIAGLTAVDGATIISDRYELLGFGAKIIRRPKSPPVTRVIVTQPVEGSEAEILEPSQLGGTRHLSAAQFEQDQRDAIALVASQDGRFTVFAWSPCEEMVHAHRIETLLL